MVRGIKIWIGAPPRYSEEKITFEGINEKISKNIKAISNLKGLNLNSPEDFNEFKKNIGNHPIIRTLETMEFIEGAETFNISSLSATFESTNDFINELVKSDASEGLIIVFPRREDITDQYGFFEICVQAPIELIKLGKDNLLREQSKIIHKIITKNDNIPGCEIESYDRLASCVENIPGWWVVYSIKLKLTEKLKFIPSAVLKDTTKIYYSSFRYGSNGMNMILIGDLQSIKSVSEHITQMGAEQVEISTLSINKTWLMAHQKEEHIVDEIIRPATITTFSKNIGDKTSGDAILDGEKDVADLMLASRPQIEYWVSSLGIFSNEAIEESKYEKHVKNNTKTK